MGLLPNGYRDPTAGSNYMKLEDGVNKFRILTQPAMGWVYWVEEDTKRKPVRVKDFKQVPIEHRAPSDNRQKAKYFWAMLVWNYNEDKAQLLEVTQAKIRNAITGLDNDPDWGDARDFDIAVTKSGKDLTTDYVVNPKPKSKFDKKDKEIPAVNLEALFDGEDPFDVSIDEELADDEDLNKIFNGELDSSEPSSK